MFYTFVPFLCKRLTFSFIFFQNVYFYPENFTNLLKELTDEGFTHFYKKYRKEFFQFGRRFELFPEELEDIYQDACIVVIENLRKGKLDDLKSSFKTYLFSVGKFLAYKRFHKQKLFENEVTEFGFDPFEKPETPKVNLKVLGKKCRELLELFYYEEKKLDERLILMNYKDKNVLKSQKSRCLAQLKEHYTHG